MMQDGRLCRRKVFIQGGPPDTESTGNLRLRHPISHPLSSLGHLSIGERLRPTLVDPARLRPGNPLRLALLDNGALKLGDTAHKAQHQLGDRVGLRRVGLPLTQKPHRDPTPHQVLDNRVQVHQ